MAVAVGQNRWRVMSKLSAMRKADDAIRQLLKHLPGQHPQSAHGAGGGSGDSGQSGLSSELGGGVSVQKTVGGLTSVQSTTGRGLTTKQVDTCIGKMKKGQQFGAVFTATTGRGDAERGKTISGKIVGKGKLKATGQPAAIVKVEKGDFAVGEKATISALGSYHSLTWG